MAIIIRESRKLGGKEYNDLKIFKSDKFPITVEEERNAIEFDDFLSKFIHKLTKEVEDNKLLNLKGKDGVIKLWFFIGKRFAIFDNPKVVDPIDMKYLWKAIWYHAKELSPGDENSRTGTNRDHFLYCYRLAKYDEQFVLNAGNWSAWQEFFDSPILSNKNILDWFEKKSHDIKMCNIKNWLRKFIKLIRNEFQNKDLSFLSKTEIKNTLDKLLANLT